MLAVSSPSYAALTTVGASRAAAGADLTDGITYDNAGAWVVTVADGSSLGTTAGVSAATAGAGGANAGTLTYAGDTTVAGDLGTAANQLLAINFNGSGKTATLSSAADILGATTITVGSGATMRFGANTTVTGALVTTAAAGTTMNIGSYTVTQTGATTFGAASTLGVTQTGTSTIGNIQSSGNATIGAMTVDVNVAGTPVSGTALTVFNGGAAGTNGATITVTDNSARYTFTGANATGDITVTPTLVSAASTTTSTNSANVATVLNGTTATASGDFATVQSALSVLSSNEALDGAYNQLDPVVDTGATVATVSAGNQAMGALTQHLSDARGVASGENGISTGDDWKDMALWAKGFGNFSEQDERSGIQGFDAWTAGAAIGFDEMFNENLRLGIAGGYAFSNVDSEDVNNAETDIDSIQGTIYGSHTQGPWYIDAAFSFAYNMYDATRDIVFGTVNRKADADFDGQQYITYVGGGYEIQHEGWEITPMASLQWTHLNLEDYTETGANSLNLIVEEQDYDVLQSGLGAKIAYPMQVDSGVFTPAISAKWLYDFIGDEVQTTSTFTGGGASFTTQGYDPAQHSFDLGVELKLATKGNWTFLANYDLELKEDFTGHNGVVTARFAY